MNRLKSGTLGSFLLVTVFVMIFSSQQAFAYNIKTDYYEGMIGYGQIRGGHEQITSQTIARLAKGYTPSLVEEISFFQNSIIDGTTEEDSGSNPITHFYDPSTGVYGVGLFGFLPSAQSKAEALYWEALDKYRSDKGVGWKYLGRTLHILQDMASPSHVNNKPHMYHAFHGVGYEWWVDKNWNKIVDRYVNPFFSVPSNAIPIGGGKYPLYSLIFALASATQAGGYSWDYANPLIDYDNPLYDPIHEVPPVVVSDGAAEDTARFSIPLSMMAGGGLFETFWKNVNYGKPPPRSDNTSPGGGNPDDNFDVSSRLIELEQLDVTTQGWKDLYGRTGIKKGYNGLFFDKALSEAYAKAAASTTKADYQQNTQRFATILDRAQTEAKHSFEETYYASADVALLSDAFVDNAAEFLLKRLKEPIREVKETFNPTVLLRNQPVLLIPSGALTGFNDSPILKATLDEYVKNGGTLIVLSQKHGYDYASIPTPDGKPITGYGWEEDQNCFADAVSIETWHQMLSGQSRSTPTVNVDGYFTGYPANSTILLRRTANGQPALLMYEHGQGRVIVTSMYSDWAYGHGQASREEIAMVRDILSWAKKPTGLPEIKPGETVTLSVTLTNSTATDATSIKLQIYNPDRTTLLNEQTLSLPIPAGQPASTAVAWQAPVDASLGIYHIDYILLDSAGNVIQPQAETDSGRFVE
jgi:hypothetical protein